MRSSRKHDVNYLALVKLVTRESGGDYQLVTGVTVRVFGTAWWARTTDPQIHKRVTTQQDQCVFLLSTQFDTNGASKA